MVLWCILPCIIAGSCQQRLFEREGLVTVSRNCRARRKTVIFIFFFHLSTLHTLGIELKEKYCKFRNHWVPFSIII